MRRTTSTEQVNQAVLDRANNNRVGLSKGILIARIMEVQEARREVDKDFELWRHNRRLANLKRLDWSNT